MCVILTDGSARSWHESRNAASDPRASGDIPGVVRWYQHAWTDTPKAQFMRGSHVQRGKMRAVVIETGRLLSTYCIKCMSRQCAETRAHKQTDWALVGRGRHLHQSKSDFKLPHLKFALRMAAGSTGRASWAVMAYTKSHALKRT